MAKEPAENEALKQTEAVPEPSAPESGPVESQDYHAAVAKSTLKMSLSTLLSRITGFIRTWACAFAIGNTLLASAYQVANNMPNMIYELVAGGILTTAFLPVYVAQLKKRGKDGAGDYASTILALGAIVLGIITILATIFARPVIFTQTFMTNGQDAELAVFFFRFFAIQIIFYGIGAIISGILNGHREFLWPAIGPVFNNVIVIITMFAFVPISGSNPQLAKVVLACGTSLGVLGQFAVQLPALKKLGLPLRLHIDIHDPALKETLKLAIPATIFVVVNILVISCRNAFSLNVAPNGPSTLSYAWLWYQFPYGVLAVALSTAMLTEMSESAAVQNWEKFRENVRGGLSGTMFLIIPLAMLMFALAEPLISLYHAGQFTSSDISQVSFILRVWSVSLPFYAGYMYLYRSFSAMQDLGLVTKIDVIGRVLQSGMYFVFTSYFGLGGIPVADGIFYFFAFFVLCFVMKRKVGSYGFWKMMSTVIRSTIASTIAAAIAFLLVYWTWGSNGILASFGAVLWIGILGLVIFYLIAKLLRTPETELIGQIGRRIGNRFFGRSK